MAFSLRCFYKKRANTQKTRRKGCAGLLDGQSLRLASMATRLSRLFEPGPVALRPHLAMGLPFSCGANTGARPIIKDIYYTSILLVQNTAQVFS
jgi:hypothetical protein